MKKLLKKLSSLKNRDETDDEYDEINEEDEAYEEDLDDDEEIEEEELDEEIEEEGPSEKIEEDDKWLAEDYEEGQLSIDVFQTPKSIIVKSTIAGVKPGDIDISISNDMLTIRGKREMQETIRDQDYLYRECYWGSFSRSIILPVEVEAEKIDAVLENGVLTIVLPKAKTAQQINIKVKEK